MNTPSTNPGLALRPELRKVLDDMGYHTLTPIQEMALPELLAGKDVIGQSITGSGKTAAFGIPLLEKIDTSTREIQGLVLCPTRELCEQVAREIRKIGRYKKDLQIITLTGGHPIYLQLKPLEHGAHIAVGTPGRLLDHLKRQTLKLDKVNMVVLDEADRMLDMGFRDKIETLLEKTPETRQTVLFSATYPPTIEGLSLRYQKCPKRISVAAPSEELPPIEQLAYRVPQEGKINALLALLRQRPLDSALVFCNLKVRIDQVTNALQAAGHRADRLHGDLDQNERERVMAKFRNHTIQILVATDVAARGIDVAGVGGVINFDMPNDPANYVHRIGRTGRAGLTGLAVSLLTPVENPKWERLEAFTNNPIPVQDAKVLGKASPAKTTGKPEAMDTLSISGGRKDKLRPGDILGALTQDIGIPGDHVGKIEILDRVSFVALSRKSSRQAFEKLKFGKIKGRKFMVQWVN